MSPIPPVTKALLWAIGIAFLLQQLQPETATVYLALWPIGDVHSQGQVYNLFQPWQLLTYAFLHGGFVHLFVNAFGLIQFGPRLERALGQKRYLQFLAACTLGAGACQLVVTTLMLRHGSPPIPTVGASGFIYGILLAWAVMWPHDRVLMILPPMEVSVRTMQGVAHFAHLGGMAFGWLLLRYWQGKPPFGRRGPPKKPKPPHLRSVN